VSAGPVGAPSNLAIAATMGRKLNPAGRPLL